MTRFLKWSIITLTSTIILLAGLIFIVDLNTYQPLITRFVKEKMHRNLEFNGDLSFAAFPNIKINLQHIAFSEYKSSKKFLTAEHIHLTLPLNTLLREQPVINGIIVKKLKVSLIRFTDGRTNIDDLLNTDKKTSAFNLGHVQIKDATLVLQNAMINKQITLNNMTFGADRITTKSIEMLELKTTGSMKTINENNKQRVTARLEIPNLQFVNQRTKSKYAYLAIQINNPHHKTQGALHFSNLVAAINRFDIGVMMANIATINKNQMVRIKLKSTLNGKVDSQKLHFPDLETKFIISTNNAASSPIRGSLLGSMSANGLLEQIDANLAGNIENSHIQTTFKMVDFNKPTASFDMAIDQLDTERFNLNAIKTVAEEKKIDSTQPRDEAIDFSLLTDLNIDGSIHIGTLQSAGTILSNVQFNIQPENSLSNPASTQLDNTPINK